MAAAAHKPEKLAPKERLPPNWLAPFDYVCNVLPGVKFYALRDPAEAVLCTELWGSLISILSVEWNSVVFQWLYIP